MRIGTTIFATVASLATALALSGLPNTAAAQTLPGYSARPDGMCWTREFGSGQDITGGYWAGCPKATGNSNARTTRQREPAPTEAHASTLHQLPGHGTSNTVSEPIYFGLATGSDE
jgi:hypothetical protein